MYHESIEESKIDIDLLKAADKYLIEDLLAICVKHLGLESNLTLDNALDIMMIAYQTNQTSLFETATNFVMKNKGKLIKTDSWKKLSREHPDLIVKAFENILAQQ